MLFPFQLIRSTAACVMASASWTMSSDQDHRRITFVAPFMLSFVTNMLLLTAFSMLIDFSELGAQSSNVPLPLYIFNMKDSLWTVKLLGSLDTIVLLLFTLSSLGPIVASIDVITSKLGNTVRVDLSTVQIKPTIIRKVVWFVAIVAVLALELLFSLDQLLAISETFGLLLVSCTFLMTIIRSYKTTLIAQYVPLAQSEPSLEGHQRADSIHQKLNESSEESETDIDTIVEEYKIRRRLEGGLAARRRSANIRDNHEGLEPTTTSFLKIKVVVNITIGLTGLLSILMIHVWNKTAVLSSAIVYVIISFFLYALAIKQPRNTEFEPRLPLMPLLPLLCLNVCIFLQPYCLQEVWPAVMILAFVGKFQVTHASSYKIYWYLF